MTNCKEAKREQLIGQKFGRMTVVEFVGRIGESRKLFFRCQCDCGNQTNATSSDMRSGRKKSCGCLAAEGRDPERKAISHVLMKYRQSAKKRGFTFNLSREVAVELLRQNCHYCNRPPSRNVKKGNSVFVCGGIDRLLSMRDYTRENCVPCCYRCNRAKGTMSPSEFSDLCREVVANFRVCQ